MTPSKYQAAIYEETINLCMSKENLPAIAVDAVAGSGKTTTGVAALERVPQTMACGFFAFNKSIAEELGRRVPPNVVTKTFNSFGNQIVRQAYICPPKLNMYKTDDIAKKLLGRDAGYMLGPIKKIIGLLKGLPYLKEVIDPDKVTALMDHHDIEFNGSINKLFQAIQDVWTYSLKIREREIDFDDQIFLTVYDNLNVPRFDLLMVDESQDLNPVQMELVIRSGRRVIIVGDSRQAIYGFRGADPESMSNFIKMLNAKVLPLSICYRCSKNVVRQAQKIVPHIEYSESQKEGIVDGIKAELFRKQVTPKDFVLCRTTAPLVGSCLKFIREGIKATVKGRDIGVNLAKLVDKISCNEDQLDSRSFGEAIRMFRSAEIERLERSGRESKIQTIEDQCDTLNVFVETCENVIGIKSKIYDIFSDNAIGIQHMTKHRSKGLEANTVYILSNDPIRAKRKWMQTQEANLNYVGITRAMENLYFVGK